MKMYFSLLDLVRFFAAFWVMNFHYFLSWDGEMSWHRYGNLGVQLFFIVSGFVITQSMYGKNLKTFALGRFIRLFPLFWILCTISYIVTLLVPDANPVTFAEYLISMTMLGDKFGSFLGYSRLVDPAYWTLAVELIFYMGVGIYVYLFSDKYLRYFFASWFVFSFFVFFFSIDQNFIVKLMLVRHAAYFVFGGMLAIIITKQAKNIYESMFDWTILIMSALFATYIHPKALPPYFGPIPVDVYYVTILHIFMFIGVLLLVYLSPYIKNKKTLHIFAVIGGLTYPLYLLHQTIGSTIINFTTSRYPISHNHVALILEVLVIVLAYIAYRQDKTLRGWLKKKILTSEETPSL